MIDHYKQHHTFNQQETRPRSVVSSISLKGRNKQFIDKVGLIRIYKYLLIVIVSDERGITLTTEQRLEIYKRVPALPYAGRWLQRWRGNI